MANQVLGKNVITELKVDGVWYPIFCAKSASLDLEQDEIETTTIDTGNERTYIPGMSNATISCNGITSLDNSEGVVSVFYLLQQSVRRTIHEVRQRFIDQDGTQLALSFSAFVRTLGITRDRISYSQSAVVFRITGGINNGSVPAPVSPVCNVQDTLYLDFPEGDTYVENALLEADGVQILWVARSGSVHSATTGTPGNLQYRFTAVSGRISFDPTNPSNGESVEIGYQIIS